MVLHRQARALLQPLGGSVPEGLEAPRYPMGVSVTHEAPWLCPADPRSSLRASALHTVASDRRVRPLGWDSSDCAAPDKTLAGPGVLQPSV